MKQKILYIPLWLFIIFFPAAGISQSNKGTDFWTGFGFQEKMRFYSGENGEAKLSIYILAGDQPASVLVSLPGIPNAAGFPKMIQVFPNTVTEITGFPTGDPTSEFNPNGLPDTRLYYTGVSARAIHITSSAPIAVYESIYASDSHGMSMLLPTDTWGNKYIVQTIGGKSNLSNANSNFFIIAEKDSTLVTFVPANDIVDSSAATIFTSSHTAANVRYHAGTSYSLLLNKGQVFNAMGFVSNNTGVDLSGTPVTSRDPLKKIALFSGNGRVIINPAICNNPSGSDNLFQQMFPKALWGRKYLTAPAKTMEYGIYRITVADTSTEVKINGAILPTSSLIAHAYYQVENNNLNCIEANKNVMLTQYITSPGCPGAALGNNGQGDPEIINLSPLKYGTNKTLLYLPNFKNGGLGASYINVVIKKEGIASFNLDNAITVDTGTTSFAAGAYGSSALINIQDAFKKHPQDSNYYYARFKVARGATHSLISDSAFAAIAYGMNSGESYGFNAGFTFDFQYAVYSFIGTGNWSEPSNWLNNTIPPAILPFGSEIIINGNCILNIFQVIEEGATITVMNGANLTVTGNLDIHQ